MKSYTDIEQSRKLAKILPLESADMYFAGHQSIVNPKEWDYEDLPKVRGKYIAFDDKRVFFPCWSLAALLGALPSATLDSSENHRYRVYCNERFTDWHDNPIDACVAMLLKLHEQKIL